LLYVKGEMRLLRLNKFDGALILSLQIVVFPTHY